MPSSAVSKIVVLLASTPPVLISGQRDGVLLSFYVDPETLQPIDDVMYKNPLPEVSRNSNKWFGTRKLQLRSKANAGIMAEMLDHVEANKLVQKARDKEMQLELKRLEKLEKQIRADVMRTTLPQADAWGLVNELLQQLRASATANDTKAQALIERSAAAVGKANLAGLTKEVPPPPPYTPEGQRPEDTTGAPPLPGNDFQPRS